MGSLFCTSNIDTLGKKVYNMPEICYNYKGVLVPPLGMVDHIITVTKVRETGSMNKLVNTLVESKKLGLSKDKCHGLHLGKGHKNCPDLLVN